MNMSQNNQNDSCLNFVKGEKTSFYVWHFISTFFLILFLIFSIFAIQNTKLIKKLGYVEDPISEIVNLCKKPPKITFIIFFSLAFYSITSIILYFKTNNKINYLNKKIKKYEDVIGALSKNLRIMEFGKSNKKCMENSQNVKKMPHRSGAFSFFFWTFFVVDCLIKIPSNIILGIPLYTTVRNWLIFNKERRLRNLKEKFGNLMELPFFQNHLQNNGLYGKTMEEAFDYYYINHHVSSLFPKN